MSFIQRSLRGQGIQRFRDGTDHALPGTAASFAGPVRL